jgi:antitoxin component of RelBE/YafQ-DinJ toxin-antitoxin module
MKKDSRLNIRISKELLDRIRRVAKSCNISVTAWVTMVLTKTIDAEDKDKR